MIFGGRLSLREFHGLRRAANTSIFVLGLSLSAIVYAQDTLTGTVIGRDGSRRTGVSVDVLGPSTVYTETNAQGAFSARLRPGNYVIRVRDGRRQMEFQKQVAPGENVVQLQLSW
jgi:hypothetical protein